MVRLPRVLCVALSGTALALCGGVMQGLLRNPLADGSTLGVSAGASLGAVTAIALGISFPFLRYASTMVMAIAGALLSLRHHPRRWPTGWTAASPRTPLF